MSEQEDTGGDVEEVAQNFAEMVTALDPEDRAVILTELASRFCMACGHDLDEDGDCLNDDCVEDDAESIDLDEDEDEDEEDDEDEDDGEEEDQETLNDELASHVEDDEEDDAGDDGDPDEEDEEAEH